MSLPQVKVDTWGGFVFINFDLELPSRSKITWKSCLITSSASHWKSTSRAVHVQRVMNCNWKVGAEAFMESWHTVETHKQILTFTGDANSQYDTFGDNVSRSVTPMGVASPHLE